MRLLLLTALLLLASCKGTREDPPLFIYDSHSLASLSAAAHAKDVGGKLYAVLDTHSMEPLLMGGDLIVVEPCNYDLLRVGQVIVYRAEWTPAGAPPVTHRVVLKDSLGLVLSGDNNARSESGYRVTRDAVLGIVVGIYRVHLP
jgi:signal peptidase I